MKHIDFHPGLRIVVSEKEDGNLDNRFGSKEEVKENRKQMLRTLKISPFDLIEGQQIHFKRLLTLDEDNAKMWRGNNITGIDGFLTDQKDITLMIRVADCVPVVLYDPVKKAVALLHVGWKGATLGIQNEAIEKMERDYKSNPKDLLAWIGPAAQACCYRSDKEPEQIKDKNFKPFIKKKAPSWSVDIPGFLVESMKSSGVLKKNMTVDSTCTVESDNFFSHQKSSSTSEKEGRFGVLVKLV
jgi:YfiH family protein